MIGTKLAHYEITSHLGSGGMGDVYQATDTKLGRSIAIKFLPEAFSHDSERVARFQREARVLASLNHPGIATIYGVEEIDGRHFLVMELVPGETLADRIKRGAIPIEEALPIAKQIAEALEEAHEKGIIHRDLKPANIKLTADGRVKVLDFGLAKAMESAPSNSVLSNSPTLINSMAASNGGMIIGTAAYMSPEQARGRSADVRSDVFSFGCVLYEMLAGKQAFQGEDVSDILASVLAREPEWSALPQLTPPTIVKLIRRCLVKDRRQRLQAIGDARIEIELPPEEPTAHMPRAAAKFSKLPWATAAVLAVVALALAFIHFREQPVVQRTERYTIAAPANSSIHSLAISPDGRYVVIAAAVSGKQQQLWLRPLDALEAQPMATTEDATYPFWSPDSRYIGFFAQGRLKKIAASGGPAQSLCDAVGARGGTWNHGDIIVFSRSSGTSRGLQRVPASGGAPADVPNPNGTPLRYPAFLPDGRHFLYTDISSPEKGGIYLSSLDGAENRRILPDRSAAFFSPSFPGSRVGHLLFIRENNLMALPFDAGAERASGELFPVAEGVFLSLAAAGYAPVTISENGVLLFWAGNAAAQTNEMVWYDRAGKPLGSMSAPGAFFPAISPDEKDVAFARSGGSGNDLWLRDLARATDIRLTSDGKNFGGVWSPKGDRIAFTSSAGQGAFGALYHKAASGSSQAELLFSSLISRAEQWSRDGRFIVFTSVNPRTNLDVWVLPLGHVEDRKPVLFLETEFNEFQGQLSPDSRWMAYTSDESGLREVYVRPFPPGEGRWKVSTAGGEQPRWRGDGKELFYAAVDGKITAVAVKTASGPTASFDRGVPVPLFDSHIVPAGSIAAVSFQYDVTADGKRFLVATSGAGAASSPPLNVVVNWQVGLKK